MREVTVETEEEFLVVAHVRGWCHHSTPCRLCKAEVQAFESKREAARLEAAIEKIIGG